MLRSTAFLITDSGSGFDRLPPLRAAAGPDPAPTPCQRCGRYPWEPCNGAGVAVHGCARGRLEADGSMRALGNGTYEVRR